MNRQPPYPNGQVPYPNGQGQGQGQYQPMPPQQNPWGMPGQPPSPPYGQQPGGQAAQGPGQGQQYAPKPIRKKGGQPNPPRKNAPGKKKKKGLGSAFLVILIIGLSAYYIFTTLIPLGGPKTATVLAASAGQIHSGDALIVRNEQVFEEEGVYSVEYNAQEGSVVYRQDPICKVYTSSYNQRDITNLATVRSDIKTRLRELVSQQVADQRLETLDANVLNKAKEARKIAQGAKGNLLNIEADLAKEMSERKNYLKTNFSEDQRLTRLYNDENTYARRISSFTGSRTATKQAIVSFYTDGFEVLSTSNMENYSPNEVAEMIKGVVPAKEASQRGKTPIYRLIDENHWGVFFLIEDSTWNPARDSVYKLKLEQFENTIVEARVVSTSKAGNKLLIRMDINSSTLPVLDIRTCKAEIGEDVGGLVVPRRSLTQKEDMIGVVVLVDGIRQSFVPVTVIKEEGDKALITPVNPSLLFEGLTVMVY